MNIILHRNPDRALTTWSPFYRPTRLWRGIDELTRELWSTRHPVFESTTLAPYTDIYEENGEMVIKTDLPGISQDNLEVTLEGDTLTITAEKKDEVSEDATHHRRERYYGRYHRSMVLPYHIDGDSISATFENGVLELKLTKAEELKPRRIKIKTRLPETEQEQKPEQPQ